MLADGTPVVNAVAHAHDLTPGNARGSMGEAVLLRKAPRLFAEAMAEFLFWGGPGKLLYSDGALFAHPRQALEAFAGWQLHDDLQEKYGLPAMGLVRGYELDDRGVLTVDVCVTAPGCAYVGLFADAAAHALAELPGVTEVVVRLDPAVVWSERLLRTDAAELLATARPAGGPAPERVP